MFSLNWTTDIIHRLRMIGFTEGIKPCPGVNIVIVHPLCHLPIVAYAENVLLSTVFLSFVYSGSTREEITDGAADK